jgi:hypothetical protein
MSDTWINTDDMGEFDCSTSGFPDMDAPHPFPDGSSASGFGRSNSSSFSGTHVHSDGTVQRVAKVPGGGGLSGDFQPEDPRLRPEED